MIDKAVIPAAGSGTRLLPATQEMPKEMLPVFSLGRGGRVSVSSITRFLQITDGIQKLIDWGLKAFTSLGGPKPLLPAP